MKTEFKNGSTIESIDTTSVEDNIRGKRSNFIAYQDVNLKWYQKIYFKIYVKMIGLLTRFGHIKSR